MAYTPDKSYSRGCYWTAVRKLALLHDIRSGRVTLADAALAYDLSVHEIGEWIDRYERNPRSLMATRRCKGR